MAVKPSTTTTPFVGRTLPSTLLDNISLSTPSNCIMSTKSQRKCIWIAPNICATRSETDKGKGIQCNPCGADRVPGSIKIPVIREGVNLKNLSLNLNVNDLSLSIKSKQFFPQTTLAVNPQKRTDYAQQSVTRCLPNKIIHQLQSTQWTMKKRKKWCRWDSNPRPWRLRP